MTQAPNIDGVLITWGDRLFYPGNWVVKSYGRRHGSSHKPRLGDHKYVMVLHDHQANPHVHVSVRAESKHGQRLNPLKADLQRWRETFAERLRKRGVEDGDSFTRRAFEEETLGQYGLSDVVHVLG
jgi:type IV secretory pathway VirD2 relaxase